MSRRPLPAAAYRDGVRAGDRRMVAKTITLLESTRPEHAALGREVLEQLVPFTGRAVRIGVSGTPGVGKSSFIEMLGIHLIERGHRVAVLAIDPSSPRSGGSILGDKTRMERLARSQAAFIRPSPSGGSLGGLAHRTREAMLVCEAAGFDVVLIETVGIGQSEAAVASLVDFFALLIQPGAGDELQGIKRGVLELADALLVNKADGALREAAERARAAYAQALGLLRPGPAGWRPPILLVSARTGEGIEEFWRTVERHRELLQRGGELEARRRAQARQWMWSLVEEALLRDLREHPKLKSEIAHLEREVEAQRISPAAAARALLESYWAEVRRGSDSSPRRSDGR